MTGGDEGKSNVQEVKTAAETQLVKTGHWEKLQGLQPLQEMPVAHYVACIASSTLCCAYCQQHYVACIASSTLCYHTMLPHYVVRPVGSTLCCALVLPAALLPTGAPRAGMMFAVGAGGLVVEFERRRRRLVAIQSKDARRS